ncbi:C-type lectin domain family 4 member M-like [Tachysurus fulvidraco]|uniref:C-type lectin domain family 4 member M-like n=1 Tax=Tachysurus fulvidraco TaxID=1234273 RepID=UPI001FEDFDB2|nr:C-type lectin domain family 4 member M-like [Tachysurus fulvidraco]
MEQRLFMLLCFTGAVHLVLSVPIYFLIQQGKTWSDAQAYCRAEYTDLAIIKTRYEMDQFKYEIQGQQFSSSAWIGLYNAINSWRWSMGNEPLGSAKLWNPGQPDNSGGHEVCVVLYGSGWSDVSCSSKYPVVCFDASKRRIVRVKVQSSQDVNDPALKEAMLEQIKQKLTDHGMAENITVKWKELPDVNVFFKEKK